MNRKKILTIVGSLILGVVLGVGLMMVDDVHIAVKKAVGSDVTSNYLNRAFHQMDMHTMLEMVQKQRVNNLAEQMANKITELRKRNEQLALLHQFRSLLVTFERRLDGIGSADPIPDSFASEIAEIQSLSEQLLSQSLPHEQIRLKRHITELIQQVDERTDNLRNMVQTDMEQLHELNIKQDEAMELMRSFIDKMNRANKSITGNM